MSRNKHHNVMQPRKSERLHQAEKEFLEAWGLLLSNISALHILVSERREKDAGPNLPLIFNALASNAEYYDVMSRRAGRIMPQSEIEHIEDMKEGCKRWITDQDDGQYLRDMCRKHPTTLTQDAIDARERIGGLGKNNSTYQNSVAKAELEQIKAEVIKSVLELEDRHPHENRDEIISRYNQWLIDKRDDGHISAIERKILDKFDPKLGSTDYVGLVKKWLPSKKEKRKNLLSNQ